MDYIEGKLPEREAVRRLCGERPHIWAVGTNAAATQAMLRSGANEGATGEIIRESVEVEADDCYELLGEANSLAQDLGQKVVGVQTVSDELWEQAKRLLRDHHL